MPKGVKRLKTASTRSEQKKNGIPASKGSLRYAQNASLFRFAPLNIGIRSAYNPNSLHISKYLFRKISPLRKWKML